MLSKSAVLAVAASSVSAALLSPASTTYAAGTHSNYGCRRCILEGFMYCEDNVIYKRADTVTTTGKCKDPTVSTCGSSEMVIQIDDGEVAELEIMKCSQPSTTCGTADWTVMADYTSAAVTVQPAANIAQYQQCSWGLRAICGTPIVKKGASTTGEAYLLHYTPDSRMSRGTDNNGDSSWYPASTTRLYDLETNCASDASTYCSGKTEEGEKMMLRLNEYAIPTHPQKVLEDIVEFTTDRINYLSTVWNFWEMATPYKLSARYLWNLFMPGIPTISYPDSLKWSEMVSTGGWGDLSQQTMATASTYYYEFGVYGYSTTDPKTNGAPLAMDLNGDLCADRVALVMVYNPSSSALTTSTQQYTFSVGALNTLSENL